MPREITKFRTFGPANNRTFACIPCMDKGEVFITSNSILIDVLDLTPKAMVEKLPKQMSCIACGHTEKTASMIVIALRNMSKTITG